MFADGIMRGDGFKLDLNMSLIPNKYPIFVFAP